MKWKNTAYPYYKNKWWLKYFFLGCFLLFFVPYLYYVLFRLTEFHIYLMFVGHLGSNQLVLLVVYTDHFLLIRILHFFNNTTECICCWHPDLMLLVPLYVVLWSYRLRTILYWMVSIIYCCVRLCALCIVYYVAPGSN